MKLKKFLAGAFLGMFAFAGVAALPVSAQTTEMPQWWDGQSTTYNPSVQWSGQLQWDSLIQTIKKTINTVLWFLSLIAVVLCLYAGFLMMTSSGDEKKYKQGTGILKWAAIGLAVIACAWLFVSLIFWFINGNVVTSNNSTNTIQ